MKLFPPIWGYSSPLVAQIKVGLRKRYVQVWAHMRDVGPMVPTGMGHWTPWGPLPGPKWTAFLYGQSTKGSLSTYLDATEICKKYVQNLANFTVSLRKRINRGIRWKWNFILSRRKINNIVFLAEYLMKGPFLQFTYERILFGDSCLVYVCTYYICNGLTTSTKYISSLILKKDTCLTTTQDGRCRIF